MNTEELTALQALRRFLDGSDHLDGAFFGERHPERRGAFWWRTELALIDKAHDALLASAARAAELEVEVARIGAEAVRLRSVLIDVKDALAEYACHGEDGAPCLRSKDQCRNDCGLIAGDAYLNASAELER